MNRSTLDWWVWIALFCLSLLPALWIGVDVQYNALGPNPVETLSHRTGDWVLRFLMVVLAITPLRILFGWSWPVRYRRMIGLFVFFYATLHFLTWLLLDKEMMLDAIIEDIYKRPYITVGFIAYLFLVPLAATSTRAAMRRLGRRWKKLHRLVYLVGVLGVIHYLWQVKLDVSEPLIYAAILLFLLFVRFWYSLKRAD